MQFKYHEGSGSGAAGKRASYSARAFRVGQVVVVRPHDVEDCGELKATILEVRPTGMRVKATHDCGSNPHADRIRHGDEFDISVAHVFGVLA